MMKFINRLGMGLMIAGSFAGSAWAQLPETAEGSVVQQAVVPEIQLPEQLGETPPCLDAESMPAEARVPCAGIVIFKKGVSAIDARKIVGECRGELRRQFKHGKSAAVILKDLDGLLKLRSHVGVDRLIPDRAVHKLQKESKVRGRDHSGDGQVAAQVIPAGITRIGAAPGSLSLLGTGIGVAIIDTGIDLLNADLQVGASCFSAFASCQDGNGHGTHVAGTVAAKNNSIGVVGVVPAATVYAVKVLDNTGAGSDSTVMAGLEWLINNAELVSPRIRVANMSLGRPGSLDDNPAMRSLMQTLHAMGISIVVAAGNNQSKEVSSMVPATYPEVLAIASSTAVKGGNAGCRFFSGTIAADTASFFTTDGALDEATGIGVTMSAPGEDREDITKSCSIKSLGILSLKPGGGTARMSGTSMASPHAAGVVALLVEQGGGNLDPEIARCMVRRGAVRIGVAPLNSPTSSYSFDGEREGILRAGGALSAVCP